MGDREEFEEFKKSIRTPGLHMPIEVTENIVLVWGYRRLMAVKELSWKEIDSIVKTYDDPL